MNLVFAGMVVAMAGEPTVVVEGPQDADWPAAYALAAARFLPFAKEDGADRVVLQAAGDRAGGHLRYFVDAVAGDARGRVLAWDGALVNPRGAGVAGATTWLRAALAAGQPLTRDLALAVVSWFGLLDPTWLPSGTGADADAWFAARGDPLPEWTASGGGGTLTVTRSRPDGDSDGRYLEAYRVVFSVTGPIRLEGPTVQP